MVLGGILAFSAATLQAQTPAATSTDPYYAAFTVGATLGQTTGAVFGAEGGWSLNPSWDLFVEAGRMSNAKTEKTDVAASTISQYLAGLTGGATTFDAKVRVPYVDVGARYKLPMRARFPLQPYVGVGIGAAKVSPNVTFTVNGTNVTARLLDTFGVQLGSDLSGSQTKAFLTVGLGTQFRPLASRLGHVSYRYGRVFLPDQELNTNRVQVGIGVRF